MSNNIRPDSFSGTGSASDSESSDRDVSHNTISIPNSSVGLKRGAAKDEDQDFKKKAKMNEAEHALVSVVAPREDGSKKLCQRVFSDDDEIGLLKGMLEFRANTKSDPFAHIDDFLEFMKNFSHLDVTKSQLYTKIKRLKGKFKTNSSKVTDGHDLKFRNSHKKESYELSKRIWGINMLDAEDNNVDGNLENTKLDARTGDDKKLKGSGVTDGVGFLYMYSALEQRIIAEEIENLDRKSKRRLDKKLIDIEVAELQLFTKKCEYLAEKAKLICSAKKELLSKH